MEVGLEFGLEFGRGTAIEVEKFPRLTLVRHRGRDYDYGHDCD